MGRLKTVPKLKTRLRLSLNFGARIIIVDGQALGSGRPSDNSIS